MVTKSRKASYIVFHEFTLMANLPTHFFSNGNIKMFDIGTESDSRKHKITTSKLTKIRSQDTDKSYD